jgi:hypothetical protein
VPDPSVSMTLKKSAGTRTVRTTAPHVWLPRGMDAARTLMRLPELTSSACSQRVCGGGVTGEGSPGIGRHGKGRMMAVLK